MYETPFHLSSIEDQSFLITGGAGFIGSNLVQYLLQHNARKVRVLDDLSTGSYDNILAFEKQSNFEFIKGDITDLDTCCAAAEGIDLVSHQAALGSVPRSVSNPIRTAMVNAMGFVNMLEGARLAGVKRLVFASSSSIYGENKAMPKAETEIGAPISPYAASKQANESFALAYDRVYEMRVIGLRYFNVFGPRQNPDGAYAAVIPKFIQKLQNDEQITIYGDGEQTRDFTFVENVVQANLKALTTSNSAAFGQMFNIAVGQNYSVNHMVKIMSQYMGMEGKVEYAAPRKGDIVHSLADASKAKELLQFDPGVAFEAGLRHTIDYMLKTSSQTDTK